MLLLGQMALATTKTTEIARRNTNILAGARLCMMARFTINMVHFKMVELICA